MLKPKVEMSEFEKFGFKRCKGEYGKAGLYYLCVAKGCKTFFVSKATFLVCDWDKFDPRIHKNPNCRYSDSRDMWDMLHEMIQNDWLERGVL